MGYKAKALNDITKAAYYHDLGKIHIADDILNKPSKLNIDEYEEIKKHVEASKDEIIKHFNPHVFEIIYQHHERYDGSGYPNGLVGNDILEEARILAICDSYDAMITNRIYKKGKSPEIALLELRELSGILYDPEIVAAFTTMILE
jgi:HD-GYP domain-containing protein (c-di-GMP phosphodiesterase class II)